MPSNDPIQILVVDDSDIVREGLVALLSRQADMQVEAEATNGQEAVALFRQHRPDVVVMDLRMPTMNGVEATTAICQEFPHARIVVLTTWEAPEDLRDALRAGAKRFLVKGGDCGELLEAIRAVHVEERDVSHG